MIWALLAILGVPIWLIVGALAAAVVSRRRFKAQPGVFRLKQREPGRDKWPRRSAYGRLIHDVLVVNAGLALVRTNIRGVQSIEEVPNGEPVAGLDRAAIFRLTFDDGSGLEAAVDDSTAVAMRSIDAPGGGRDAP